MRAIVLLVCLAELALQACLDLSAHTDTISNFDTSHFVANLDGLAYDLVTDADGQRAISPATVDRVDIGAADTATLDLDVNVAVFERLRFELWWA